MRMFNRDALSLVECVRREDFSGPSMDRDDGHPVLGGQRNGGIDVLDNVHQSAIGAVDGIGLVSVRRAGAEIHDRRDTEP
jgi:hypothetical protein